MSDPSKPATSSTGSSPFSLFGQSSSKGSSSAPATGGLFGQNTSSTTGAAPASNNLFGGGQKPLFGGGSSSSETGAWGQNSGVSGAGNGQASAIGSAAFGFGKKADETTQPASSPFAAFVTPNKTQTTEGTVQTPKPSLFGTVGTTSNSASQVPSGSATPATTQPKFSFGNVSTTPAGPPPSQASNIFSLGQPAKSGSNLFGAPSTTQSSNQHPQSAPANLPAFGNQAQAPAPSQSNTSSLFGNSSSLKTGSNLFSGQENATQTPSLFGIQPNSGNKEAPPSAPTSQTAGTNTSTSDSPKTGDPSSGKPGLSFPSLSTANSQPSGQSTPTTTAPTLFGNLSSSTAPSNNLFANLGEKKDAPASSSSTTPSLFPSFGQKKDALATSASAPSVFPNLGEKKDTSTLTAPPNPFANAGQKQDAPGSGAKTQDSNAPATTTSQSGTTTAQPTSSLFGSSAKSAAPPAASIQATGGTATTTAASVGTSTAGPAPSTQSRLKNKSMDEIITRWASDLSKYQKEFQTQAEKVAAWDRMLLENGNAISKLYSKTFQAERDTAEVQKQLSAVEGHQDELSHWLDRYEREVDEMIARQVGQGEGLQGPDQERERTYKTAERVSERLNEMGKDLTSMIEEINEASAAISKTSKADDPLSQIVRILNGHLSQLQLIDQGTAALQAKVASAQKESQRLGARGQGGGLGYDAAADNFYRSFIGKS